MQRCCESEATTESRFQSYKNVFRFGRKNAEGFFLHWRQETITKKAPAGIVQLYFRTSCWKLRRRIKKKGTNTFEILLGLEPSLPSGRLLLIQSTAVDYKSLDHFPHCNNTCDKLGRVHVGGLRVSRCVSLPSSGSHLLPLGLLGVIWVKVLTLKHQPTAGVTMNHFDQRGWKENQKIFVLLVSLKSARHYKWLQQWVISNGSLYVLYLKVSSNEEQTICAPEL